MLASKACQGRSKSVPLQRISNPTGVQYLIIHFKITTTMEQETKLPRPSMEVLKEFKSLLDLCGRELTEEQSFEAMEKLNSLIGHYDLSNYVFEDPATGKKGVKNPVGQILLPAEYEGFTFEGDCYASRMSQVAAMKNGKYGIVAADGTGKVICDFRFDLLKWYHYAGLYIAWWDGDKSHFGLVNPKGEVVVPNVVEKYYEPMNGFMLLERDGKVGGIDTSTGYFVMPEYDSVEGDIDENMIFHKDGVEGYVVEETGEFVPKEVFEEDEKYDGVLVYNTFVD